VRTHRYLNARALDAAFFLQLLEKRLIVRFLALGEFGYGLARTPLSQSFLGLTRATLAQVLRAAQLRNDSRQLRNNGGRRGTRVGPDYHVVPLLLCEADRREIQSEDDSDDGYEGPDDFTKQQPVFSGHDRSPSSCSEVAFVPLEGFT
jgi:hypothetical protein